MNPLCPFDSTGERGLSQARISRALRYKERVAVEAARREPGAGTPHEQVVKEFEQ